jgi:hypothetical protein
MAVLGLAGGGLLGNFGDVGVDQLTFGPAVFGWFAAIGALTVVMIGGVRADAVPGTQRVLPPAPERPAEPEQVPEPSPPPIADVDPEDLASAGEPFEPDELFDADFEPGFQSDEVTDDGELNWTPEPEPPRTFRSHAPTQPPGPLEDPEDLMFTDDDGYDR